jgi:hypothetical protein
MIHQLLHVVAMMSLLQQNVGSQAFSAARRTQVASVTNDNAASQMAHESPEIWRVYDDMSSMSMSDRKDTYRALSSSMKAAVWAHHLRKMLIEHPEFTSEQVGLINDFLTLLTPEFFEVESFTAEWWARIDAPLQELGKRAKTVFDSRLARAVFADLAGQSGEHSSPSVREQSTSSDPTKRQLIPNTPYCECSTISDYCYTGYKCVQGGCYWTSAGCGLLWDYSCTGLCIKQDDGGG